MKNILSKITKLSATNKASMKEIQTDNTNKVNTVTISKIYTVKNTKTNKVFINKNMIKLSKVSTNLKKKTHLTQNKTVSSTLSTTLILQIMKSSSFNKLKTNPILSFKTPLFLKLLNIKVSTLIQFSHLLMNLLPNSLIIEFRNQSQ